MPGFFEPAIFGQCFSLDVVTKDSLNYLQQVTPDVLETLLALRCFLNHHTLDEYIAKLGVDFDKETNKVTLWRKDVLRTYKEGELRDFFIQSRGVFFILKQVGGSKPIVVVSAERLHGDDKDRVLYVKNFYVQPEWRGRGIGTEMLAYITHYCYVHFNLRDVKVTLGEKAIEAKNPLFYAKFLRRYNLSSQQALDPSQDVFIWPASQLMSMHKRRASLASALSTQVWKDDKLSSDDVLPTANAPGIRPSHCW